MLCVTGSTLPYPLSKFTKRGIDLKNGLFSKKRFITALLCGLICSVLLSQASFNSSCDGLRDNILRLHIIANSDSEFDQALKLRVRDKILESSKNIFVNARDINGAVKTAESATERFEQIALSELKDCEAEYGVKAQVTDSYFETREYENFTLPAGIYKSLLITLGSGNGKNWWCVIFPEVCLPAASSASLSDTVPDSAAAIAYDKKHYVLRFKAVEIYEEIKNSLGK